ncbi:CBS domain-containing protein [Paenibacillus mesophilus]|uniref:GGDEF domain-containing protein n=1 Tax=Paenibacillus mesophilus TaxID=2582849 RepID=UPI00110EE477|nr:GGDEF domain-containing protein [Paenibacillus mesophilus]TMV52859.1 CBS domain-containing protein [Paenibacillus mesophilus]
MKVGELMSSPVQSVSSDKSVRHASELMARLEIGSLVVQDHGSLVGILTSRDVRQSHPNRIVADAMTRKPVSVPVDSFVWDALGTMERLRIERLLVTDNDRVCGIITRDTIRIHLSELQDPLTGLFRPAYVQAIGEELLRRRERFHLLFIDLNDFGEINKRYGHPVGDDLIKGFADKLLTLATADDYLCRYAGDEFVIVTVRPEASFQQLVDVLREPQIIEDIPVSMTVGTVSGQYEPGFFSYSFRDLISKASLLSTSLKPNGLLFS